MNGPSMLNSVKSNQVEDPIFSPLIYVLNANESELKHVRMYDFHEFSLENNLLLYNGLIFVPESLRKKFSRHIMIMHLLDA